MKRLLFIFSLYLVSCSPGSYALDKPLTGQGTRVSDSQAVKCVLGEYESGTLEEMKATAEALFNRGTTKGVFGCKAVKESKGVFRRGDRVIPKYAVKRAFKAVSEASTSNLVKGADHWESIDFKRPSWSKNMILTAKIGKHEYFKEVK